MGFLKIKNPSFFWALNAPKEYSAKFAIVFVQSTKFYQNWSNCSSVIASQTDRQTQRQTIPTKNRLNFIETAECIGSREIFLLESSEKAIT